MSEQPLSAMPRSHAALPEDRLVLCQYYDPRNCRTGVAGHHHIATFGFHPYHARNDVRPSNDASSDKEQYTSSISSLLFWEPRQEETIPIIVGAGRGRTCGRWAQVVAGWLSGLTRRHERG